MKIFSNKYASHEKSPETLFYQSYRAINTSKLSIKILAIAKIKRVYFLFLILKTLLNQHSQSQAKT
jgi:hypothetical protein